MFYFLGYKILKDLLMLRDLHIKVLLNLYMYLSEKVNRYNKTSMIK